MFAVCLSHFPPISPPYAVSQKQSKKERRNQTLQFSSDHELKRIILLLRTLSKVQTSITLKHQAIDSKSIGGVVDSRLQADEKNDQKERKKTCNGERNNEKIEDRKITVNETEITRADS